MVPRENKSNTKQNFGRQTKSIMLFLKEAYASHLQKAPTSYFSILLFFPHEKLAIFSVLFSYRFGSFVSFFHR